MIYYAFRPFCGTNTHFLLGENMFKSILIIFLLMVLVGAVAVIVFGKAFIKDIKSKDIDKKMVAEEKSRKLNIVGLIVFFCTLVLFLIVVKIF